MDGAPDRRPSGVGAYPGSFDPPTTAHLAIAVAALERCGLERIDLVLSRAPLGKDPVGDVAFERRLDVVRAVVAEESRLAVAVTEARLIVDVVAGYDVVVMGLDKWEQVIDPAWYGGSEPERDAAVARLPRTLVVPRAGERPSEVMRRAGERRHRVEILEIPPEYAHVSSSAVRAGAIEHAAPRSLPNR
jgi:Cytidylyltransferase-like